MSMNEEILKELVEISCEAKTRGHDVFVDIRPHINGLGIHVYLNGWEMDARPKYDEHVICFDSPTFYDQINKFKKFLYNNNVIAEKNCFNCKYANATKIDYPCLICKKHKLWTKV